MAVIVNGDGILTGISSLATALTDLTSGRGTVTGVATVGTLQLGAGVSMSSPRSQNAAIFTNNSEFLTVDDAGRVGVGTISPNTDAHPQNVGKINVGFITARSIAGDIDANTMVVAGISTFVGALNGSSVTLSGQMQSVSAVVTGGITATGGNIVMNDSSGSSANRIKLGTSQDLNIYHNGTHSFIQDSGTGNLMLATSAFQVTNAAVSETMIYAVPDGAVSLYYDNAVKIATLTNGVQVTGQSYISEGTISLEKSGAHHHRILANDTGNDLGFQQSSDTGANTNFTTYLRIKDGGDIALPVDNQKLRIGAGGDIQIYYTGSAGWLYQTDSGNDITLGSNAGNVWLRTGASANKDSVKCVSDGAVELYYNGTKHFETGAGGNQSIKSGANTFTIGSSNAGGAHLVLDGDSNGDGSGGDYSGVSMQTDGNMLIYQDNPNANGQINFQTGGANRFSMQSDKFRASNDNACTLGTDGLAWANVFTKGNYVAKGASGTGVDFAHSASAGTASNILDDYEEGSWTPGVYPESSAMTLAYDLRTGSYVKIGRVVYWHFRLRLSSFSGNGNQTIGISGLPATVDSSQPQFSAGIYGYNFAGQAPIGVFYHGGTTRGRMYYYSGTPSWSDSYASDFQNNTYLAGSGFYFIA